MFDGTSVNGRICQAIAFAEGCLDKDARYMTHSLPYRLNNPGDLKATSSSYTHHMNNTGKLQFDDIGTGWNALAHQVMLMETNKSEVYNNNMTLLQIAEHYAREHDTPAEETNAINWANNVGGFLGVTKDYTLQQIINFLTTGNRPVHAVVQPVREVKQPDNQQPTLQPTTDQATSQVDDKPVDTIQPIDKTTDKPKPSLASMFKNKEEKETT